MKKLLFSKKIRNPKIPFILSTIKSYTFRKTSFCFSSQPSESVMFAQRLNAITGEYEWVVVEIPKPESPEISDREESSKIVTEDAENVSTSIKKPETNSGKAKLNSYTLDPSGAIANSLYLDMLNDNWRNHCYYQAIRKAVRHGDRILDIGQVVTT